jgi:uncharacterized damage-inducible protein DinB
MNLEAHFRMLAQYSLIANERLFAQCAQLGDAEYRMERAGSFVSIHGLLNHILLEDRRWMGLFESGERVTPPPNQILYEDFSELRDARRREDVRIEAFFARVDAAFWSRSFSYTNNQGKLHGEGARGMHSFVQPPDASSGAGLRDAESDRCGASGAGSAPHHQSLGSGLAGSLVVIRVCGARFASRDGRGDRRHMCGWPFPETDYSCIS